MDNPPPQWRGICQVGESFDRSHCNRLINFLFIINVSLVFLLLYFLFLNVNTEYQ